jgi:hypothetical protein
MLMIECIQVGDGRDSLERDSCLNIGRHLRVLYITMKNVGATGQMPQWRAMAMDALVWVDGGTEYQETVISRPVLLDHFSFLRAQAQAWMATKESDGPSFLPIKSRIMLITDLFTHG